GASLTPTSTDVPTTAAEPPRASPAPTPAAPPPALSTEAPYAPAEPTPSSAGEPSAGPTPSSAGEPSAGPTPSSEGVASAEPSDATPPEVLRPAHLKVVVLDYDFGEVDVERSIIEGAGFELIAAQCKNEDDVIAVAHDAYGVLCQYAPVGARAIESF